MIGSERIRLYRLAPGHWALWIPPTRPEDVDDCGDLVGPAGDTYFESFSEACDFLAEALKERAA